MKNRIVLALVLGFLAISTLLSLTGIIDVRPEDILGYAIVILGLSLVYPAFKSDQKLIIFVGSGIFLTGVSILVFSSFELTASEKFITPLLLLIAGISLFLVYFSDRTRKLFLIISVIVATSGIILMYVQKESSFTKIFHSILPVIGAVWPIFLILVVIIILVSRSD